MIFYDAHNNYSQLLLLYGLSDSRIAELCLVGKKPESKYSQQPTMPLRHHMYIIEQELHSFYHNTMSLK